ncbi:MAG: hypothetical protein GF313_13425 [Caldithrix sp.]|nr:hypothetical protein [Caldithrix sp.]
MFILPSFLEDIVQNGQPYQAFAEQINQFIEPRDNFLLSAHINADGDAIASVVAMKIYLEKLGKHAVIILHDETVDTRFEYLKHYDEIQCFSKHPDLKKYLPSGNIENAIFLDVPGLKRLGDISQIVPPLQNAIKIDHHPSEDRLGQIEWVDEVASSTTAMVYEIIQNRNIEFDAALASAIYTGIVYDTGRFSFSNTTSRDLFICAKMAEQGADPVELTNRIFFQNSFQALKTIGRGLSSLENYLDGKVNVIYLSYEDMTQKNHGEIEELANYSVAIRGGEIGLFIREVKPNYHKVSFRSNSTVDVNKIAKVFNGGGHSRAAGCRIEGKKQTIIPKIINEIASQISS